MELNGKPLEKAFLAIPSVQQRRVHVPLDVRLTPAGSEAPSEPMLLQPEHLEPLLADGSSQVLLISADGGTGKTSLAVPHRPLAAGGATGGCAAAAAADRNRPGRGGNRGGSGGHLAGGPAAGARRGLDPARVEALLRNKRLIPILDHVSELPVEARQRLVENLPPGLVIATSRSLDDGYRERPLSRHRAAADPPPTACSRFFLDYLRRRQQGQGADQLLKDDDLVPAQNQLRADRG